MWRACEQQPPHDGMFCLWFGVEGAEKLNGSEHFCCQVSAAPICSSHRASSTRSAINQTAVTSRRASRGSIQKEIKATCDFIKRLQLLCSRAEKEHRKQSWSCDLLVTWKAKILHFRFILWGAKPILKTTMPGDWMLLCAGLQFESLDWCDLRIYEFTILQYHAVTIPVVQSFTGRTFEQSHSCLKDTSNTQTFGNGNRSWLWLCSIEVKLLRIANKGKMFS